jgi:hypothetical protein
MQTELLDLIKGRGCRGGELLKLRWMRYTRARTQLPQHLGAGASGRSTLY